MPPPTRRLPRTGAGRQPAGTCGTAGSCSRGGSWRTACSGRPAQPADRPRAGGPGGGHQVR
eukprot:4155762-Pyramimonas_sp.AAC.1